MRNHSVQKLIVRYLTTIGILTVAAVFTAQIPLNADARVSVGVGIFLLILVLQWLSIGTASLFLVLRMIGKTKKTGMAYQLNGAVNFWLGAFYFLLIFAHHAERKFAVPFGVNLLIGIAVLIDGMLD